MKLPQRGFRRLPAWQTATVVLLFLGYAGHYFWRSDLSVALPLILQELHSRGMDRSKPFAWFRDV